jgi:hypothetical protein
MKQHERHNGLTAEEIICESLRREQELLDYYAAAAGNVGPDAFPLFAQLQADQAVRMESLRRLLNELAELKELTVGIAD